MRPRPTLRSALAAGALSLALPVAPAAAQSTATIAPRASRRSACTSAPGSAWLSPARPGPARPAIASLQIKREGRWRTIDRARTGDAGRYVLRDRVRRPMSVPARVRVGAARRRVGRLNVYRTAYASWYGPGLYGNHLGCGGRLSSGSLGVAHKTLPCGSKVTLRRGTRTVRVRVIDRGPYVAGREYDLTETTARRLRFTGHGSILTTR